MKICLRMIYIVCGLLLICFTLLPMTPLMGRSIDSCYVKPEVILVSVIGDDSGRLSYVRDRYSKRQSHLFAYIEANQGERYSIRISNTEDCRVGLVISVDGLNIITGEKSNNSRRESMYVLRPGETCDYSGWRSSMNHEQRFYFTRSGNSYAGRMGFDSQIGVIKVTAFKEKNAYYYISKRREHKKRQFRSNMKIDASYSKSMSLREADPGTGYGENNYSKAVSTNFNPEKYPSKEVTMKCKWAEPRRPSSWKFNHHKGYSFATPPPNY